MIHAENLTKYYQDLCAVDRISFEIPRGEVLGFLGPNGAGKTTTLRMLTGFIKPGSGTIRVKDFDIREQSLDARKIMGYLPESAPLYHDMLVFDYLDYVARIRQLESAAVLPRIRELAELCGLGEVMHKPIGELSKGYKQRVGLAHAMMSDPEILVLDEPTSGLDPNQIAEIRDIIREIGRQKTVILSTHILSEVEATCDRVLIISRGKIVADGTTATLRRSAGGEVLIHLLLGNASQDAVVDRLARLDGVIRHQIDGHQGGAVRVKLACQSDPDLRPEIYRCIKQTDWVLLELVQESKSLEHIFRELTQEQ